MRKRLIKGLVTAVVLLGISAGICVCLPYAMKTYVYPEKYKSYVERYADENQLDPYFIYAIIKTESNFNPEAVSNVGARGLMQMMEDAFDWVKFRMNSDDGAEYSDMFDPDTSIRYGTYMIGLLYQEYQDEATVIAAYHGGRNTVNQWLKNPDYSKNGKTLDEIPSKTTAHYVYKVMKAYQGYKNLYQQDR